MEDILNSEYNNMGELLGLGELERATRGMNPVRKAAFLKKMFGGVRASRRSRGQMEKFFKQLPKHVKQELLRGSLRLADFTVKSVKHITSKTIKMFETQDDKEVGLRNISNSKLPKNTVMLVSGIILLTGRTADINDPEANKAVNFNSISRVPAIANGEFSLKANRRQIVPENNSNRKFVTDNNHNVQMGYYELDNPRLIKDEELMEFTVELGTMYGIGNDQFLEVCLDGTITTP